MINEIPFSNLPVLFRQCGLDFFIIDGEHGAFDYREFFSMINAARLIGGIETIVRIPSNQRKDIVKLMDMGADSLLLPMTNCAEDIRQVENVESASLYLSREHADNIFYNNTSLLGGGKVFGIDGDYFSTCGYVIKSGRGFTDKDYSQFRKVAIIDQTTADSLLSGASPPATWRFEGTTA